jgi:hypothetical protein
MATSLMPWMAAAGICVFFEHAPLPTAGFDGSPWTDSGLLEIQIPLLRGRNTPMRPSLVKIVSKTFADSGTLMNCPRGFAELAAERTAEQQRNNSRITGEISR